MILLLVAVALKSTAQELNCKFTVNYSQIQGTSTQVFTTLENALMEFINPVGDAKNLCTRTLYLRIIHRKFTIQFLGSGL